MRRDGRFAAPPPEGRSAEAGVAATASRAVGRVGSRTVQRDAAGHRLKLVWIQADDRLSAEHELLGTLL